MMTSFDPVVLSTAENLFLLKHLGEPSIVALKDTNPAHAALAHPKDKAAIVYPDGVVPGSVKPILDGVAELLELEKHEGLQWVGVEGIKQAIHIWLEQNAKWKRDHQRTKRAPRWPSLYSFDSKGRPHLGGPGSDSGTIKTYFGPAGERIPFAIDLMPDGLVEWTAPGFTEAPVEKGLFVDPSTNRIECRVPVGDGFCGHTESYKSDSRQSYNAARARMSKHLRKAIVEIEAHRELHTNEFGN